MTHERDRELIEPLAKVNGAVNHAEWSARWWGAVGEQAADLIDKMHLTGGEVVELRPDRSDR